VLDRNFLFQKVVDVCNVGLSEIQNVYTFIQYVTEICQ